MYTLFFGLSEKPFSITPDPRYLYLSARHGEALAHLLYGVTESGGFVQLTGEVGTGKTTLVRSLLEQLPEDAKVALILNPKISPTEFLQAICEELGVELPAERNSSKALVDTLNKHLLEAHSRGERVVLIVDEAQNLSADVLEQVRLLTNLETAKQKLLQIILIGQPELREILDRNDLRQLAQRITGRYHLEPLSREESASYIKHRLQVAGAAGEVFTPRAIRTLHRLSGGIPRVMNVISDRALLGAYTREQRIVRPALVKQAAREVYGRRFNVEWSRWLMVATGVAVAGAIGIGIWRVGETLLQEQAGGTRPVEAVVTGAPVEDPVPEPVPAPDTVVSAAPAPTQRPESPSAPPAIETPPETLEEMLAAFPDQTGTDAAFEKLFALWGNDYDPASSPPCEHGRTVGLRCAFQKGSWGELRRFNRPAILSLTDDRGLGHQVVLSALQGDSAVLELNGTDFPVSVDTLSRYWSGDYLIMWRPQAGGGTILAPGMNGPGVLWLRQALTSILGDVPASSNPSYFDDELADAVKEFQAQQRLMVDGIAGMQTQITMSSVLEVPGTPTLLGRPALVQGD